MPTRFIIIIAVLVVGILGCSLGIPTPPAQPGDVLFKDDFTDPASGWDRVTEADGITDYAAGIYRIYVNSTNTDVWSNPGLSFTDVQVEVDTNKAGGDNNNLFGILCRYQDAENYYFFLISSDGYYGIGKTIDGNQQIIGSEFMVPSELINQGDAANHLRGDCVGNQLSLAVNEAFLATVEDSDLTSGDVGLIAGTINIPGTDIYFDNFVVIQP